MGQSVRGRFEFQGPCHGICSPALCSSCTLCPFLDYVSQVHFCCRAPFVLFPVVSVCLAPLPSHLSNVETLTVFSGLYNPGQPQRSIAQTEGTLSQLKVTKRQVICQAVPELNPGTGFWGLWVFEPKATNARLGSGPQGLISTPVLPCSSLRSGRQEMAPDPGSLIAMVSPT